MLYLDYAKKMPGGFILNFFADNVSDIEEVSNGKPFITKNGTNYGVPLASSSVVITMPDSTKLTYVLDQKGEWVEGGVPIEPAFVEEYNMASMGTNIQMVVGILCQGLTKAEYLGILDGEMSYFAKPAGHGYYTSNFTPEEGSGQGEAGKIIGENKDGIALRQFFDPNKEYKVEFIPKLSAVIWDERGFYAGIDQSPEAYKRYVYICRIIPGDHVEGWSGPGGYMINRDCPLATAEEAEQFLQDLRSEESTEIVDGPEFMLTYTNITGSNYTGGDVSFIERIYTTKECEFFILNISEV